MISLKPSVRVTINVISKPQNAVCNTSYIRPVNGFPTGHMEFDEIIVLCHTAFDCACHHFLKCLLYFVI